MLYLRYTCFDITSSFDDIFLHHVICLRKVYIYAFHLKQGGVIRPCN